MFCPAQGAACDRPKASGPNRIHTQLSFRPTNSKNSTGSKPASSHRKSLGGGQSPPELVVSARGVENISIVTWMKEEVVPRLQRLDDKLAKLDKLAVKWNSESKPSASFSSHPTNTSFRSAGRGSSPWTPPPDPSFVPMSPKSAKEASGGKESSWRRQAHGQAGDQWASWAGSGEFSIPLPHGDVEALAPEAIEGWNLKEVSPSTRNPDSVSTDCTIGKPPALTANDRKATRVIESDAETLMRADSAHTTNSQAFGNKHSKHSKHSTPSCGSVPPGFKKRRSSLRTFIANRDLQSSKVWLWNFLDNPDAPEAGPFSHAYHVSKTIFTILAVGAAFWQTVDYAVSFQDTLAVVIEVAFAVEFVLRFAVCPNHYHYFAVWHNFVDMLSIAPLVLRAMVNFQVPPGKGSYPEDWERNLLLGFVPVIRLLKLVRRFERFRLMLAAVEISAEALPVCIFSLALITSFFSMLIFMVEPRDNINSLPQAVWLTMVTMTTVGYGDITPASTAGSMVAGAMVITSVLYMAMPLGIIGQAFTEVWGQRDMLLLKGKTKDLLRQWAYKARDIPMLFEYFDQDEDGTLTADEFIEMIKQMRIGLSEMRALELFNSLDSDGSGFLEGREFVKALFPHEFQHIYPEEEGQGRPATPFPEAPPSVRS